MNPAAAAFVDAFRRHILATGTPPPAADAASRSATAPSRTGTAAIPPDTSGTPMRSSGDLPAVGFAEWIGLR